MSDCIFCKIITGDVPSNIVFENEDFIAFSDIQPVAPIHIVVVPKVHDANLNDFAANSSANFLNAISQVAKTFVHNGYRVIFNTGSDAGQTVFHVHAHILAGEKLSGLNGNVE